MAGTGNWSLGTNQSMTQFMTSYPDTLMLGWYGETFLVAIFIISFGISVQRNQGADAFTFSSFLTFIAATLFLPLDMITVASWMICFLALVGSVAATSTADNSTGVGV